MRYHAPYCLLSLGHEGVCEINQANSVELQEESDRAMTRTDATSVDLLMSRLRTAQAENQRVCVALMKERDVARAEAATRQAETASWVRFWAQLSPLLDNAETPSQALERVKDAYSEIAKLVKERDAAREGAKWYAEQQLAEARDAMSAREEVKRLVKDLDANRLRAELDNAREQHDVLKAELCAEQEETHKMDTIAGGYCLHVDDLLVEVKLQKNNAATWRTKAEERERDYHAAKDEIRQLTAGIRDGFRVGNALTLETQTVEDMAADLVRQVREARMQRDGYHRKLEDALADIDLVKSYIQVTASRQRESDAEHMEVRDPGFGQMIRQFPLVSSTYGLDNHKS